MIRLRSVTFTYPGRERPALSGINFSADIGEFVLVSGPSGSGKSTFLRALNGLIPHFSGGTIGGTVEVGGLDVIQEGPQTLSRLVGFVSQNPEAQSILETVEPEIAFALENAAVSRDEMRKRVGEAVRLVGLGDLRQRAITTLSGGERQRVAIASALALLPQVLVLDEPTSQLDPAAAASILQSLRSLNEELGLTVILAEHRLERVLPFVDRVIYFEDGRLSVDAPVQEALERLPTLPPLQELARGLGWQPIPLTFEAARNKLMDWQGLGSEGETPRGHRETLRQPMLTVENLHFSYDGRQPALNGVDLNAAKGEITVVMGANGSGKSTLLRCLIGLLKPSKGEIRLNGRSTLARKTVDLAREIAYLPQYPDDLLFAESVAAELTTTLHNHGLETQGRVQPLLAQLGLTAEANTYPRDLSTGQRQRVALGAITVTHPEILLLDEPTRGLDTAIKQDLIQLWRQWRTDGMALIVVTHDVELAVQLADRVLIMEKGTIARMGNVRDLFTSASTPFAPQMARLFPGRGWLTTEEALAGLSRQQGA